MADAITVRTDKIKSRMNIYMGIGKSTYNI